MIVVIRTITTFHSSLALPPLFRSCVAGRSLAGSTAWPTSAPACHSSRAACPKSGWLRLPYSPASARSSTGEGSWRRPRTPLPQPPWHPCRPARPRPPPAPPPCLVIPATSPAGRSCEVCWETWGWTCGYRSGNRIPAAADESNYSQKSCQTALKQGTELLPALGENVSQIFTAIQSDGRVFLAGGKELLLLTKAGSSLSEHGWWISTSKIQTISPHVSFIILPASSAEWKANCLPIKMFQNLGKFTSHIQILPAVSWWTVLIPTLL